MNYIYDVYLNLNKNLYDFFDWNKNDKLIHVKKIPIFKISEKSLIKIIKYEVKVKKIFIDSINCKTEVWNNSTSYKNCSLFTDGSNIIAIEFDNEGNSIKKSYLQIDEELEILEEIHKLKEKCIDFKIISKRIYNLRTRKEVNDEEFVNKELKNIEIDKLKFIYLECFNKESKNNEGILNKIRKISKNSQAYKKLTDILKLTSTNKNKMI